MKGHPLSSSFLSASSVSSHPLAVYGWDEGWEAEFAPYAEQGLLPGRVARVDRGLCDVITPAGTVRADTEFVVPRDPMKAVGTGDWGAVDPEASDPLYVRTLLPRRTAFVRSTSSKRSEGQVLATTDDLGVMSPDGRRDSQFRGAVVARHHPWNLSNIDYVVICVSLAVELDLGRIERFLALATLSRSSGEALLHNAADSCATGRKHTRRGCRT